MQGNITTLGTIGTGTWNGSVITGTYGGTGVNNGSRTLTTTDSITIGSTGTSGQLFYTSSPGTISGLTTNANSGLLSTAGSVPVWVNYTGSGAPVLANTPTLITPNIGVATATSINDVIINGFNFKTTDSKAKNVIYIGAGVVGIGLYIAGEATQINAGKLMNKNKSLTFAPASEGIGIALKF